MNRARTRIRRLSILVLFLSIYVAFHVYYKVKFSCFDNDSSKDCELWKEGGHCESAFTYMLSECTKTCNLCHLMDPQVRCKRSTMGLVDKPAYEKGQMQVMFENISKKYSDKYEINVLSSSPWIITLDNFLSDLEIKTLLLRTNETFGWEQATEVGQEVGNLGETSRIHTKTRTSSYSWCWDDCIADPIINNVLDRMQEIVSIPINNFENIQVLKYEPGQLYVRHHDMDYKQVDAPCGPRILTFFLYLSDVEDGGETSFSLLDIKVKPKKGMALIWPNTLSDIPTRRDVRTFHEALPVLEGTKLAANAWIRLHDFTTPLSWRCADVNIFDPYRYFTLTGIIDLLSLFDEVQFLPPFHAFFSKKKIKS